MSFVNLDQIQALIDDSGADGVWCGAIRNGFEDGDAALDYLLSTGNYIVEKKIPVGGLERKNLVFKKGMEPK